MIQRFFAHLLCRSFEVVLGCAVVWVALNAHRVLY